MHVYICNCDSMHMDLLIRTCGSAHAHCLCPKYITHRHVCLPLVKATFESIHHPQYGARGAYSLKRVDRDSSSPPGVRTEDISDKCSLQHSSQLPKDGEKKRKGGGGRVETFHEAPLEDLRHPPQQLTTPFLTSSHCRKR